MELLWLVRIRDRVFSVSKLGKRRRRLGGRDVGELSPTAAYTPSTIAFTKHFARRHLHSSLYFRLIARHHSHPINQSHRTAAQDGQLGGAVQQTSLQG